MPSSTFLRYVKYPFAKSPRFSVPVKIVSMFGHGPLLSDALDAVGPSPFIVRVVDPEDHLQRHAPRRGAIYFENQRVDQTPPHKVVDLGIAQVPEGRRLFARLTVTQNLTLGAYTRKSPEHRESTLKKIFKQSIDLFGEDVIRKEVKEVRDWA
jgi:hypothetical protein